jgi:hypothetical protein
MARDEPPPTTRPDNKRPLPVPGVPGLEIAPEVQRRHPGAERSTPPERSISPFPQQPLPTVIVDPAPPTRRSWLPRELPGWASKGVAVLFATAVLPIALAVKERIDAGTEEVKARSELLKKQAEREVAVAAAAKAELEEMKLLGERVAALESLRGEVAGLRAAVESTNLNVAQLTPATRPPKRMKVRGE